MFGRHVAVLYNKIELEFAVGGIGEAPFLKVVCDALFWILFFPFDVRYDN